MTRTLALAFFVEFFALAAGRVAAADPGATSDPAPQVAEADARCEVAFRLGEASEETGAFVEAIAHYGACLAGGASGSYALSGAFASDWAARAAERVEWLSARSEGDFEPLRRLQRVRRDPALANDPATVDSLAREADRMPPGTVRVEARMLVAEAWLGRLNRPEEAVGELRNVVEDPRADALTGRLAERELVSALAAADHVAGAAVEARAHARWLDPRFVGQIERLVRRRAIRRGSFFVLASFALTAAAALVRAQRRGALPRAQVSMRRFAPVAGLFVSFVAGAGGLLASKYESGNGLPFLLLGGLALPLVLAARGWSAVGSERPAARIARALLCGATLLAAVFVLLEALNPTYLEGFGL